ncbi:MAG: CPBP family glutamic-type intramembrane protease [Caloramator sp.]|nr:CPBP family glutamic-type intramembrane protease [Caloramator sp.]
MLDGKIIKILQYLSILLLLSLPPWFAMIKRFRNRRARRMTWILAFIPYIIAVTYIQNILPFFAVLITLYFIKNQGDEGELYYFRPIRERIPYLIGISIVFRIIVTVVSGIYVALLMKFGFKPQPQEVMKLFLEKPWPAVIYLSIMTVVAAPILEEFIFRHIFYRNFAKINKIFSAIFTSLLFMLLHYNIAGAVSFFMVGLFNCYLYEKFGYKAAVFSHFLFNLVSVIGLLIMKYNNIPLTS